MATMIGTQMAIFGIFIGFLLPGFFVDEYNGIEDLNDESIGVYKQQMFNMLVAVACAATLIAILVILTFREKPGAPLFSKSSPRRSDTSSSTGDALIGNVGKPELREIGMCEQFKVCVTNGEYVLTGIGTCGIILYFYVFTTVIGQLVKPFGLSD